MAEQGSTRQMSRGKRVPDENGFFGQYGGQFLPPQLEGPFAEITKAYHEIENDAAFIAELRYLRKHFQGSTYTSLLAKLDAADASIQRGSTKAANNPLGALLNELSALSSSNISDATRASLTQAVTRLRPRA